MSSQTSNSEERSVVVSLNPKSGRRSSETRAVKLAEELDSLGFSVEIGDDLGTMVSEAVDLHKRGSLQALVGVGGDGTAAELVNRTPRGLPITLLPAGTANLIAKRFKLPFNPIKSAKMIAQGQTLSLDAGWANSRLFLAMVSAGLDAEIVRRVHSAREAKYRSCGKEGGHISYLSYLKPLLQGIRAYKFTPIQTTYYETNESQPEIVEGSWSLVCNLPNYGWGVRLAPDCDEIDGKFDYCVFQGGRFCSTLARVLAAHLWSAHRRFSSVRLGRGARFTLSAPYAVPYQLDGDPGGVLPVKIRVDPGRFTLVAPPEIVRQVEERHRARSDS